MVDHDLIDSFVLFFITYHDDLLSYGKVTPEHTALVIDMISTLSRSFRQKEDHKRFFPFLAYSLPSLHFSLQSAGEVFQEVKRGTDPFCLSHLPDHLCQPVYPLLNVFSVAV